MLGCGKQRYAVINRQPWHFFYSKYSSTCNVQLQASPRCLSISHRNQTGSRCLSRQVEPQLPPPPPPFELIHSGATLEPRHCHNKQPTENIWERVWAMYHHLAPERTMEQNSFAFQQQLQSDRLAPRRLIAI
ncbi:hypothetical protein CGRA01v4_08077 [Colletotrichum graminicola]|nr:hypothetical protein CGRA01v4_08077 [Colletotrichum graminicola]